MPPRGPRSDLCVVVVVDVGVRNRVEVAGEHLAGDQAGEVGHVDHQRGADLVGDLAHGREVDLARVGRVAGHQDQRAELPRQPAHRVVVEQAGLGIGSVGHWSNILPEMFGRKPCVRWPPASSDMPIIRWSPKALPQPRPIVLGQSSLTCRAPGGRRAPAPRSAGPGSAQNATSWRRCPSAAARRRAARRTTPGRGRRPLLDGVDVLGSPRRSGARSCPRRTCRVSQVPMASSTAGEA